MTEKQRLECPDLYRRLKLASLRAGESIGDITVYNATTPTPRVAYLQRRYPLAGLASVGMRG